MTETDPESDAPEVAARQARSLSRLQLALAVLAVVAAGAAGVQIGLWLRGRPEGPAVRGKVPLPEASPIWAAWRAAEEGDVAAYLACFTGPARADLERELEQAGEDALAQRLAQDVKTAQALVLEPLKDAAADGPGFTVSIGRAEKTELYDYFVARGEEGWAIRKIVPRGTRPGAMKTPDLPTPPAKQGDTP